MIKALNIYVVLLIAFFGIDIFSGLFLACVYPLAYYSLKIYAKN